MLTGRYDKNIMQIVSTIGMLSKRGYKKINRMQHFAKWIVNAHLTLNV